jgi:lysyl-tRNA synthetase class 2
MLARARAYFATRDVLEVTTPALSRRTSTEPNIASIGARLADRQLYLHTSPEHCMKRLLAAGYPDIYQVCSVYRGGETGRYHLPEFTLLEWYRHDLELQSIIRETTELASELMQKKTLSEPPLLLSYAELFAQALSLDSLTADCESLASAVDADDDLVKSVGNDRDAWLDLIMASRLAPGFATDRLTVIYHYPASQAALARICPDDDRVADRFEVYCGAVELANGFVELTDADEQLERFQSDQNKRQKRGLERYKIDATLIDALRSGMPPSAGVALGLDRLLMIDEGRDDIHSVVTFTPGA